MASFQAKDSLVLGRQLEVQEVSVKCDAVAGTSDAPGIVSISNGTITAVVATLTVGENISSAHLCEVRNRVTGAIVATAAAPDISVAQKISVTFDGTALADAVLIFRYIVE